MRVLIAGRFVEANCSEGVFFFCLDGGSGSMPRYHRGGILGGCVPEMEMKCCAQLRMLSVFCASDTREITVD